jgi:hypothetical protein
VQGNTDRRADRYLDVEELLLAKRTAISARSLERHVREHLGYDWRDI